MKHVCAEATNCCCYILGDEPDEKCPVHGEGERPPRYGVCGRFVKRPLPYEEGLTDFCNLFNNNVLEIV